MKKKQITRKIASVFAAAAVAASCMAPSAYAASAGKLQLDVVDSSVRGADRTNENIQTGMSVKIGDSDIPQPFKEYWNNDLTNRDFLYTPEGLGTFDCRTVHVFDLGTEAVAPGTHYAFDDLMASDSHPTEGGAFASTKVPVGTSKAGEISVGRMGVEIEMLSGGYRKVRFPGTGVSYEFQADGTVKMTDSKGSVTTLGGSGPSIPDEIYNYPEFEENHWYVMIEDPNMARSGYGYRPSVDNETGDAWEAIFRWTGGNIELSYDDNVASKSSIGIPLHNEVLRSNFSFNIVDKDLQRYASQGMGDITGAEFAVYNLNSTATAQGGDVSGQPVAWKNDGTSPAGYVVADRNRNGKLDGDEDVTYVPAYTEDEIIAAYEAYLLECNTDKDYNGAKTYGKKIEDGEFIIGRNGANRPIIPVMTLKPDASGQVRTWKDGTSDIGASGLPTGNYIVLQVKAGDGYYIDQDFRPIISAGYWAGTPGTNYEQFVGYGRSYYEAISNTYTETHVNISKIHANTPDVGVAVTPSPVAFCPTGQATDLSSITTGNAGYIVSKSGQLVMNKNLASNILTWLRSDGPTYAAGSAGASGGKYILNADDDRMKPLSGTSRFTAQNPIIRSGLRVYLADSDDVKESVENQAQMKGLSIGADGNYLIVPQGNGSLDGAKFELTPWGRSANNDNRLYSTGVTITKGKSYVYTARDNMLLIPTDDLPYGVYKIKQISAGPGYEIGNEFSIAVVVVSDENDMSVLFNDQWDYAKDGPIDENNDGIVDSSEIAKKYEINKRVHLVNELVNGGEIYSLDSGTASSDMSVTVSVYNISEQYVYVDKDNDLEEERYETNKHTYKNQIAGKALTHEQLLKIIASWKPCREIEIKVGETVDFDGTLPYGTYLIAVTDWPEGYEVTGDFMRVDTIDKEGDDIEFDTSIDDTSMLPRISTVFLDAETLIDSIAIKNKIFLRDKVSATNLVGGANYAVYGTVIDKSTGNMLQPGMVAYATGSAYLSTDEATADNSNGAAAQILLDSEGAKSSEFDEAYTAWVNDVQSFAAAIGDRTLAGYCETALKDGGTGDPDHPSKFNDHKANITGRLKWIAKGVLAGDSGLDGTLELEISFDALDTRKLEGKTLVAYDYICSDTGSASQKAMSAETNGALMAEISPVLIAAHKRLSDEEQTVYLPTLDITAQASYTGSKIIDPSETIEGTVKYGNLEIGNKYAVEAWLVDAYGATVQMADESGNLITSLRQDFTAFADHNESVFAFEGLDASKYNKQRLTVYSTLYRVEYNQLGALADYPLVTKGDADSMGYNITDKEPGPNQVDVDAPTVKTKLADEYGRKTVNFDKTVSLKDTVTYKNLVPGGAYNSVLTLVDGEGTQLYDDEGNELRAEQKFTATKPEMTIEIPIKFKGLDLRGMKIIAYNDLYRQTESKIALVAQEHNPLAEDQTIEATGEGYKIVITTVAKNPENNTHVVAATASAMAVDDVSVRNLDPFEQYMAKTELAYAKNGKAITQFAPVETFFETDEDGNAKFSVNIQFNALVFRGETLSVYQTIYDKSGDSVVAVHNDYSDANQMLMVPDIDTVATADDGKSKIIAPDIKEVSVTNDPNGKKQTVYTTTVLDTIKYANLIPGNRYQITTEVVTADGRSSLSSASVGFTPMTANGTTSVYIDLDVTNFRGTKLVVYETVTDVYSGAEVVIHKDLTDTDQTVEIIGDEDPENPSDPSDPGKPNNPNDPGKPGDGTNIDTGVDEKYGLLFGIGGGILAAAAVLIGVLVYRKRKGKDKA